ncbi:MAG TPA: hypothetical protein VH561_23065 [Micromonosporaceae bacterium]
MEQDGATGTDASGSAAVPRSWQESLGSLTREAGENAAAARGLRLAVWAAIGTFCLVGGVVAIVGLGYSVTGLSRAGVHGGRRTAIAGLASNTGVIAISIAGLVVLAR